jgi:hypothetical protein
MTIDLVQTSCGFAVPFMDFVSDRDTLNQFTENNFKTSETRDRIRAYWAEGNAETIDGMPTR